MRGGPGVLASWAHDCACQAGGHRGPSSFALLLYYSAWLLCAGRARVLSMSTRAVGAPRSGRGPAGPRSTLRSCSQAGSHPKPRA
jgi:hypothetical protein